MKHQVHIQNSNKNRNYLQIMSIRCTPSLQKNITEASGLEARQRILREIRA